MSFKSVDDFFEYLPEDELRITLSLRQIILECIPEAIEKLSYNVPFYKRRKNICFLWPASVLWGKKKSYEGVRLGFNQGNLLHDPVSYLDRGHRKQVCYKDFLALKDIDIDLLKSYIFEAEEIDRRSDL
ncbi:MAG TPA: DUF1801 domain-containing protein [Cytophagaceae bacterium]